MYLSFACPLWQVPLPSRGAGSFFALTSLRLSFFIRFPRARQTSLLLCFAYRSRRKPHPLLVQALLEELPLAFFFSLALPTTPRPLQPETMIDPSPPDDCCRHADATTPFFLFSTSLSLAQNVLQKPPSVFVFPPAFFSSKSWSRQFWPPSPSQAFFFPPVSSHFTLHLFFRPYVKKPRPHALHVTRQTTFSTPFSNRPPFSRGHPVRKYFFRSS